ncbi:hypothetical protein [Streptacidiphilus cavernicola]|uniref:Uncharacterized protein n=1 Tax=Streptacidiphilus cavernicola TaxID=3342716 RepID=A0ABV6VVX8_9ACTN
MDLSTVGDVDLWISEELDLESRNRPGGPSNLDFCPIRVTFGEPGRSARETITPNAHMSDTVMIRDESVTQRDLSTHPQPVDNSPFAQPSAGLGKTPAEGMTARQCVAKEIRQK